MLAWHGGHWPMATTGATPAYERRSWLYCALKKTRRSVSADAAATKSVYMVLCFLSPALSSSRVVRCYCYCRCQRHAITLALISARLISFYCMQPSFRIHYSCLFSALTSTLIAYELVARYRDEAFIYYLFGLTENDEHEIGGQDIYRLKIDYITMQWRAVCNSFQNNGRIQFTAAQ